MAEVKCLQVIVYSTYANLTAPVPAGGAIHETVMEPLSLGLLWVTALCRRYKYGDQAIRCVKV